MAVNNSIQWVLQQAFWNSRGGIMAHTMRSYVAPTAQSQRPTTVNPCSLPPPYVVKLNVHAHVMQGVGLSFGMVIRDKWGNWCTSKPGHRIRDRFHTWCRQENYEEILVPFQDADRRITKRYGFPFNGTRSLFWAEFSTWSWSFWPWSPWRPVAREHIFLTRL